MSENSLLYIPLVFASSFYAEISFVIPRRAQFRFNARDREMAIHQNNEINLGKYAEHGLDMGAGISTKCCDGGGGRTRALLHCKWCKK